KETKRGLIEPTVLENVTKAKALLETGKTLFQGAEAAGIDTAALRELQLMTAKPFIYVFHTDDEGLAGTEMQERMRALVAQIGRASCRERVSIWGVCGSLRE